ncbi:MAG: hypothetical protein ACYC2G_05175 [Gemmatimonadaceae bacterium]
MRRVALPMCRGQALRPQHAERAPEHLGGVVAADLFGAAIE